MRPHLLTNQEAFTKSARHLLRSGFTHSRVERPNGHDTCLYAGPKGNSCALGVLLPREVGQGLDRLANPAWASIVRDPHTAAAKKAAQLLKNVDPCLLSELQSVHDDRYVESERRSERRRRLKSVALEYNLEFPVDLE